MKRFLCTLATLCALVATAASVGADTSQQKKCKVLAERIDRYDTQARRLQSAKQQDRLTKLRQQAREVQADLKC